MERLNNLLLVLLILTAIVLVGLVESYYLTLRRQKADRIMRIPESANWISELASVEKYDNNTQSGLRKHPVNPDKLLVEGGYISYEKGLLTINTAGGQYILAAENINKVLVINDSLEGEEQLEALEVLDIRELKGGDRIIATCIRGEDDKLTVESLQKNIL